MSTGSGAVVTTSALSLSISCDMKLHTVLLGWRRLLTKPCVSPQVAARQVIHRLLRRRESLLMEVEVLVQADANSMSAAKAEKPAPNARSIPFWPGCAGGLEQRGGGGGWVLSQSGVAGRWHRGRVGPEL